jgi:uncharacterized membrane protein YphA (DoxX/SURF4 family)
LHPQADTVPLVGLPRIQWLGFEADSLPEDTRLAQEGTMNSIVDSCRRAEERVVAWMAANGIVLLRLSLGIVFIWFGALKFVPGSSPAEQLAGATMAKLTLGMVDPKAALLVLAVWETSIGLALVLGVHLRIAIALLLLQMAGTLTPLALFPSLTFVRFPFAPTMEGQYILKNLVLISAAIVIGATLRGGKLVAQPATNCCCTGESCAQRAA